MINLSELQFFNLYNERWYQSLPRKAIMKMKCVLNLVLREPGL